uniref:Uncharacterized protein n=1 Tax=Arundo donax TaxID=35708 RepID=A0A0A9FBW2_ARUDO
MDKHCSDEEKFLLKLRYISERKREKREEKNRLSLRTHVVMDKHWSDEEKFLLKL